MPPPAHFADAPFRLGALLFLLVNIVMWAVGPVFVKYFTRFYDVWTQNAFRYSCAALMLGVAAWSGGRRGGFRLNRAQWGRILVVAGANSALQVVFAAAYYFIYPSVAALVTRADILFTCLLSYLIFHDERRIIRSPRFVVGAGLALLGLIVVVTGQDRAVLERLDVASGRFWIGVGLTLLYALLLAVYALSIKRMVRDVAPLVSFTHVAWVTAVILTVLMALFGRPRDLLTQPAGPLLLMVLSALLSIVIAHVALYAALREIKAVVSSSLSNLTPVVTCIFSAMVFGDRLTTPQMVGGGAVLAGAWLAALAQQGRR